MLLTFSSIPSLRQLLQYNRMEIILSLTWNRLTVLLALGSLAISRVHGQDEYMTCSRPVKSSRSSRQHVPLPCDTMDHVKESWCTLPGPLYPWHSVRRFVFENQGLMRRMYGEVRQLSLLRMEFSGETNTLEESREFGDLLKPITTFDPSITPPSISYITTESIPTLVVTSPSEESRNSTTEKATEKDLISRDDGDADGRSSPLEDEDPLTTISDMITTTEETGILTLEVGENSMADGAGATVEPPPPQTTLGSTDDGKQPINEGLDAFEGSHVASSESPVPPPQLNPTEDAEKTRNEGQVLFQDFEKASTTTTTEEPLVRTTNRQGVNACPVKEEVVAPYWANNTRGEVLALLNLYPFEQYIHWEKCTNEHRQMYCRDGCRCEQQYRLHRLLAFDPQNECRGIFSDWFRFPSCCVCKCYFDDAVPERVSFNRSPRLFTENLNLEASIFDNLDLDGPDVNGVDDSHFFYKYSSSFRQPRK